MCVPSVCTLGLLWNDHTMLLHWTHPTTPTRPVGFPCPDHATGSTPRHVCVCDPVCGNRLAPPETDRSSGGQIPHGRPVAMKHGQYAAFVGQIKPFGDSVTSHTDTFFANDSQLYQSIKATSRAKENTSHPVVVARLQNNSRP